MRLFKSKQEKEIERRLQVKQGRRKAERHIKDQKSQLQTYWDLSKKAYHLGDRELLQRLVTLILSTRADINNWERRMLYFDMIEAQRDQVVASAEFTKAFDSMADSILASADPIDLSRIQAKLERSLLAAEELEDRLEDFQSTMDDMLSNSNQESANEFQEILAQVKKEAENDSDSSIDTEINETLKQIDGMLSRKD